MIVNKANSPAKDPEPPEVETEEDASDRLGKRKPTTRGVALLVVTTFCAKDIWMLKKRVEFMKFLGVQPTHHLMLVGDGDVNEEELNDMASVHAPLFKSVQTARIKSSQSASGWPRNCNKAFRNTVYLMHGMTKAKFNNQPFVGWYYFESDITPLQPDFLVKMNVEFLNAYKAKKRFMGVVGEIKTDDGKVIRHMNGSAIYPFGMQHYGEQLMLVDNIPWDVAGLAGNKLKEVHDMTHSRYSMHFSTFGYKKLTEGRYSAMKRPHGKDEFPVEVPILASHLIHHGCKDGSLMDNLMGNIGVPVLVIPENPKTQFAMVKDSVPLPIKKRRSKKSPKSKKQKPAPSSPEAIRADHKAGMKWKDLIKTHHIMPTALKAILEGK